MAGFFYWRPTMSFDFLSNDGSGSEDENAMNGARQFALQRRLASLNQQFSPDTTGLPSVQSVPTSRLAALNEQMSPDTPPAADLIQQNQQNRLASLNEQVAPTETAAQRQSVADYLAGFNARQEAIGNAGAAPQQSGGRGDYVPSGITPAARNNGVNPYAADRPGSQAQPQQSPLAGIGNFLGTLGTRVAAGLAEAANKIPENVPGAIDQGIGNAAGGLGSGLNIGTGVGQMFGPNPAYFAPGDPLNPSADASTPSNEQTTPYSSQTTGATNLPGASVLDPYFAALRQRIASQTRTSDQGPTIAPKAANSPTVQNPTPQTLSSGSGSGKSPQAATPASGAPPQQAASPGSPPARAPLPKFSFQPFTPGGGPQSGTPQPWTGPDGSQYVWDPNQANGKGAYVAAGPQGGISIGAQNGIPGLGGQPGGTYTGPGPGFAYGGVVNDPLTAANPVSPGQQGAQSNNPETPSGQPGPVGQVLQQAASDLQGLGAQASASQSPDVLSVFQQMGQNILDTLKQQETDLRNQAQQAGTQIDPATQFSLDTLQSNLDKQLTAVRQNLNNRGLYNSGIELSSENQVRSGELSGEAKIMSDRLSAIEKQLESGLTGLNSEAMKSVDQLGIAGAGAYAKQQQSAQDAQQAQYLAALKARLDAINQQALAGINNTSRENIARMNIGGKQSLQNSANQFKSGFDPYMLQLKDTGQSQLNDQTAQNRLDYLGQQQQFTAQQNALKAQQQQDLADLKAQAAEQGRLAALAARAGQQQAANDFKAQQDELNRQAQAKQGDLNRQAAAVRQYAYTSDRVTSGYLNELYDAMNNGTSYQEALDALNANAEHMAQEGADVSRIQATIQQLYGQ